MKAFLLHNPGLKILALLAAIVSWMAIQETISFEVAVPDIPYTINGKKVELAVKNAIEGEPVKNLSALANPEVLEYYKNLEELKDHLCNQVKLHTTSRWGFCKVIC